MRPPAAAGFKGSAHPAGPTELRFLDLGFGDPWYWLLGGWLVGWLVVRLFVVGCWLLFFRLSVGWLMGWWVGRWVGWWLGPDTGYTQKVGIPSGRYTQKVGIPSGRRRSISPETWYTQKVGIPSCLEVSEVGAPKRKPQKANGFQGFGEVRLLRPLPLVC